jgi:hypothetical protein
MPLFLGRRGPPKSKNENYVRAAITLLVALCFGLSSGLSYCEATQHLVGVPVDTVQMNTTYCTLNPPPLNEHLNAGKSQPSQQQQIDEHSDLPGEDVLPMHLASLTSSQKIQLIDQDTKDKHVVTCSDLSKHQRTDLTKRLRDILWKGPGLDPKGMQQELKTRREESKRPTKKKSVNYQDIEGSDSSSDEEDYNERLVLSKSCVFACVFGCVVPCVRACVYVFVVSRIRVYYHPQ